MLLFMLCCTLVMSISSCCWNTAVQPLFALQTALVHLWLWTAHVPSPWLVNPTDMLWPWSAWSIWMCHYTHCPVVPFNALDILDHACMSHTCMFWAITKSQRWRERNSVCENPIQTNAWTHSAQVWELWRSYRTNSIISFPLYCTEFHSTAQTCSKTLT